MESSEAKSGLGYGKPPWVFKGSALYQLHLVKAETARAFIPKEFKLVEAFGYTLGGFFLANYEDSPSGMFDELVIIAGIVWNPPTSCAWAAGVLVNSDEACIHGRKEIGLPSQVGNFKKRVTLQTKTSQFGRFLSKIGMADSRGNKKNHMDIQVKELKNGAAMNICSINLTDNAVVAPVTNDVKERWKGPGMKISLPSFSGHTQYNPRLLKYSCQIECRVRAVTPAQVQGAAASNADCEPVVSTHDSGDDKLNRSISIMLSKPVLALKFNCLKMNVEAPSVVSE